MSAHHDGPPDGSPHGVPSRVPTTNTWDPEGRSFDLESRAWLEGRTFSAAGLVRIARAESTIPARVDYLCHRVTGRTVLHVGCCDHLPLVAQKMSSGQWLHGRLSAIASRCLGIDIDGQAVAELRKSYGITNVISGDLTRSLPDEVLAESWDMLVLGEILEHIDNPVSFLQALKQTCHGRVERLLVTVPNALSQLNQKYARRGIERINTDHRYWFTPFTLGKVLGQAGFSVEQFRFVSYFPVKPTHLIKGVRLRLYPALRDCLVMSARW